MNICENGWSNISPSLTVVNIKFLKFIQLTSQNTSIYFNFLLAVASSNVPCGPPFLVELIELTRSYSVQPGKNNQKSQSLLNPSTITYPNRYTHSKASQHRQRRNHNGTVNNSKGWVWLFCFGLHCLNKVD